MKNSLDQGTVIYGIKSDKYPAFPCYGIIITARCDIAQNKVPKYHYLVAVDASSWFSSKHGYQLVYSKTIADKMKTVCDKATALELDGQTLLSTSTEQLEIILQDKKQQLSGDRKAIKKVDELYACIQQYTQVAQIESDDVHRKKAIKSNTKSAIAYIKDIDSGKLHHYYFLPQTAYVPYKIGKLQIQGFSESTTPTKTKQSYHITQKAAQSRPRAAFLRGRLGRRQDFSKK